MQMLLTFTKTSCIICHCQTVPCWTCTVLCSISSYSTGTRWCTVKIGTFCLYCKIKQTDFYLSKSSPIYCSYVEIYQSIGTWDKLPQHSDRRIDRQLDSNTQPTYLITPQFMTIIQLMPNLKLKLQWASS